MHHDIPTRARRRHAMSLVNKRAPTKQHWVRQEPKAHGHLRFRRKEIDAPTRRSQVAHARSSKKTGGVVLIEKAAEPRT